MADLSYIQAAQEVKLTGQDATGTTVNYVGADTLGNLFVKDILNTAGQYRAQSATTTAAEALGAASILVGRKFLSITPTNGTVYWGFDNTVTSTTGTPIFKNQSFTISASAGIHIYIVTQSGTVDCRVAEGA